MLILLLTNKPVIETINQKINRSRVNYAVTLAKSLSSKDKSSVNKIWAICGFKSKKEFEECFKSIHGETFKEYIEKL